MITITNYKNTPGIQTRFLVYVRDFLKSIEEKDIALFYSEEKITYVVTKSGEKYMIHRSLNQLEEKLDPLKFFRTNRTQIIAYESIQKIEPYPGNRLIVVLNPATSARAIVSREKVTSFKDWLNY